jgi:hypothetical protein
MGWKRSAGRRGFDHPDVGNLFASDGTVVVVSRARGALLFVADIEPRDSTRSCFRYRISHGLRREVRSPEPPYLHREETFANQQMKEQLQMTKTAGARVPKTFTTGAGTAERLDEFVQYFRDLVTGDLAALLESDQDVPPFLLVQLPDERLEAYRVSTEHFSNDDTISELFEVHLPAALASIGASIAGFVNAGWTVAPEQYKGGRVSAHPQRRECVSMVVVDRELRARAGLGLVKRRAGQAPMIGDWLMSGVAQGRIAQALTTGLAGFQPRATVLH